MCEALNKDWFLQFLEGRGHIGSNLCFDFSNIETRRRGREKKIRILFTFRDTAASQNIEEDITAYNGYLMYDKPIRAPY